MILSFIKDIPHQQDISKYKIILRGLKFCGLIMFFYFIGVIILKIMDIDIPNIRTYIEDVTADKGFIFILFFVGLFAPLIEETIFRLGLSFKKIDCCISIPVTLFVIVNLLQQSLFLNIPLCLLAAFLLFKYTKQSDYDNIGQKYGNAIIYLSIIVFGLIHITNFLPIIRTSFATCLISVIPQTTLGCVLTYYRLHLGFFYGWAFHAAINSFAIFNIA